MWLRWVGKKDAETRWSLPWVSSDTSGRNEGFVMWVPPGGLLPLLEGWSALYWDDNTFLMAYGKDQKLLHAESWFACFSACYLPAGVCIFSLESTKKKSHSHFLVFNLVDEMLFLLVDRLWSNLNSFLSIYLKSFKLQNKYIHFVLQKVNTSSCAQTSLFQCREKKLTPSPSTMTFQSRTWAYWIISFF